MTVRSRDAFVLCALAGACDALTGLLLVAAPLFTLRLMHIATMPAEPIYMRWIGVFVFAVGSAYALPFLGRRPDDRNRRLVGVLEVTALLRACVAVFIAGAVLQGALEPGWSMVFFTDAALVVLQILWLKLRAGESAAS
jgi:hypothetical protein